MKRCCSMVLALALALPCAARASEPPPAPATLLSGFESVAAAEDARGLFANPAGLGVRQPEEMLLAWRRVWNTPGPGALVLPGARKWCTEGAQVLASGGAGVWATQGASGARAYGFTLASGSERFRSGWSSAWTRSSAPLSARYWDHRVGVLSRPSPSLSLGGAVDHAFRPRLAGTRLAREWTAGVALRPLALSRAHAYTRGPRLTVTGDVTWIEGGNAAEARTLIGAELEPVDGLVLRGSVADHGGYRVGIALRGVRFTPFVAQSRFRDQSVAEVAAVSVHGGEERTVLPNRHDARVAVVRVAGTLVDEPATGGLLRAGGGARGQVLRAQFERALEDPLTRGLLLDLRGVAGMAQIEELRPLLRRLEAAGKPVVSYFEYGGGRADLYLGSASTRIVASPVAEFARLGLRVEKRYWREPLAKLGVRMDRSSIGEYKSAYREYSVDSLPAPDRESIERTLDQVQSLFVSALAADRRIDTTRVTTILDGRMWTASDLVALGLVDSIGYREDALRILGGLTGLGAKPRTVNLRNTHAARRAWTVPGRIAVVHASGVIVAGESGGDLLEGPSIGHETFARTLERAFTNRDVKAVVLRIDSPGGESQASALMDHAVERAKREHRKPLVVSMGRVAASGGYFMACHADRIFADRFTYTGSIGVLYVKPSFEGAYAKLGARTDVVERGEWMGGWSYARTWDARMQASADSVVARDYRLFVERVADGRKLSFDAVEPVARGRVWLGDDARERGLVDQIGGLDDAIAEARRRGGVPEGEKIRIVSYGRPRPGLVDRLVGQLVRESLAREFQTRAFQGGSEARDPWVDALPE